jgi:hypothetical protein
MDVEGSDVLLQPAAALRAGNGHDRYAEAAGLRTNPGQGDLCRGDVQLGRGRPADYLAGEPSGTEDMGEPERHLEAAPPGPAAAGGR